MTEHEVAGEQEGISRRDWLRRGLVTGVGLAGLSAAPGLFGAVDALASEPHKGITRSLVAAAKKDGHLNVITLPRDWADYGELMDIFSRRYGIGISDAIPTGSSAQEIQAIKTLGGQSRSPDAVDVSPIYADVGKKAGLFVPYKVATWNTIPANMKDPGGMWVGDYWGAQSFIANRNIVKEMPKGWADLTSPKLKGMIAIDGSPLSAGDAIGAVFAAALANGGSLDNIEPGINFFSRLKKLGNFIPADGLTANIAKGVTPLVIKWDYLSLSVRDELKGKVPITVRIPTHGRYGSFYCQAISKSAPHPNAAKLWLEYLFSDEGQLKFLKGYTHPARYKDLVKRGKVPASLANRLPPAESYKGVHFATLAQLTKATQVLQEQWAAKVGA